MIVVAVYLAGSVRLSLGSIRAAFVMPFCVRPIAPVLSRPSTIRYSSTNMNGLRQVVGTSM